MQDLLAAIRQSACLLLFFAPLDALYSQQSTASWRDPSPHTVRFVTVDKGVRLEVLDWGGSGRPLVFLAGGGNTAHVFDDFAPKLNAQFHVYGVTRRGFGASGFSSSTKGVDQLRDDVLTVIEVLKLNQPVLVGHSIAGAELTSAAASRPDRVAGLIYLEAGYPYAYYDGDGPTMMAFQNVRGPRGPSPGASDLASFRSLQDWGERVNGFRIPEGELRQMWISTSDGRPSRPRDFPGSQMLMKIVSETKLRSEIPVPALAIFAIPHVPEKWVGESGDAGTRAAASAYFATLDGLTERQAEAFARGVASSRVVRLGGAHYIFLSNGANVLREMSGFLADLKGH